MNAKQTLFVQHYVLNKNATEAYKKAYGDHLSDNTCAASGAKLLRNAKILEKINEELKGVEKRIEVDRDYVMNGFVEIHKLGIDNGNLAAANKSLESLAKILGLFNDKVQANDVEKDAVNGIDFSIPDIDRRIREITERGKDVNGSTSLPN